MAFPSANSAAVPSAHSRARSLDALRIAMGVLSLVGAVLAALYWRAEGAMFVALVGAGLLAFSVVMVSFGRSITRRWLEFGATLGFAPASRRALLDFGTDRPVLLGRIGEHPARLRLVLARSRSGAREWLEAETELFAGPADLRAQHARASEAARGVAPTARIRIHEGRLAVRVPFDPSDALRLLVALREAADAIEGR